MDNRCVVASQAIAICGGGFVRNLYGLFEAAGLLPGTQGIFVGAA